MYSELCLLDVLILDLIIGIDYNQIILQPNHIIALSSSQNVYTPEQIEGTYNRGD